MGHKVVMRNCDWISSLQIHQHLLEQNIVKGLRMIKVIVSGKSKFHLFRFQITIEGILGDDDHTLTSVSERFDYLIAYTRLNPNYLATFTREVFTFPDAVPPATPMRYGSRRSGTDVFSEYGVM